ncbi:hypothetical protein BM536_001475 [Streptomyces phaeoluteigriseus]|uniref:DUF1206 domain-containing protein n=1 Tax=Streptomyces phaeoluteigriseus TaxID=114686 RepID=A0A1V6MZP6_9ACTN|nr:DUF1206 domain-containing protein [Streptomyces phaeoluteigriseus]OQD57766.1 hypothetical protein BM536_001475 [Streptomyces phaeoluteigriseus]
MNASALARSGRIEAGRAARGSGTRGAARAGLAARGVIYLLVGALALQIAFGDNKTRQADRQGALAEIAGRPFGSVMLWALGIGLVGMALWRLSEVVFGSVGPDGRKAKKRLMALARCAFYSFVAYSVLAFAAGSGDGGGSSDEQSRDVTARVLELPAGRWIVALAGAGIVVGGIWIGGRALLRKYRDKLRLEQMSPRVRRLVDVTGVAGGVARGLVFAAAGGFAVRAAVDYEPDRAKGLDDTLRSFAETSAGPGLLACVAAGLVLFGVFSFAMARWRKV